MRIPFVVLGVTLAIIEPCRVSAQAGSSLWGGLPAGKYAVGFRTVFARDTTRRWLASTGGATDHDLGRPIRISLWYPAGLAASTPPMRYGDYFHYDGPPDFQSINDTLEHADRESWIADLVDVSPAAHELAERLFATPVMARRNAPSARGRFPLLLYVGGLGSRADANAELGEFLASHGYVVATVPPLGASSTNLDVGGSPTDALLRIQDLEFALPRLRALPDVDVGPVAIAGHSAGGIVALAFAMRNADVAAVVGLDGSYGMRGERAQPVSRDRSFPDFRANRVTASLLDLRRANGVQGAILDSSVVAALRWSDRYVVTFQQMYHGDFTEFAPIGLKLDVPLPPNPDGRTRQTGFDGNQAAYRAILGFLDAKLRKANGRLDSALVDLRKLPGATVVHAQPVRSPH